MGVVFQEHYGCSGAAVDYVTADGLWAENSKHGEEHALIRLSRPGSSLSLHSLQQWFTSVFLPQGYPDSVSRDYLPYQAWDTLQAFASSITGALAMQAVLKGVGVGDEAATPVAAATTWLMKDGAGMVGRISFAWWKGSSLDCDSKKWRLFADVLNDAAVCLELLAPLVPGCFMLVVCVAGVFKSVVGVAGTATRAALTQHQARRNNLADVSAKDGSQETMVNLAALVASLGLLPIVSGQPGLTWFLFLVFTFLHLFANYQAVTAVTMETLNRSRLRLLLHQFVRDGRICSISFTNSSETVLLGTGLSDYDLCGCKIIFGSSMQRAASVLTPATLCSLLQLYAGQYHLLFVDARAREVRVVLHEHSAARDHLHAYFHAVVLATLLTSHQSCSGIIFGHQVDSGPSITEKSPLWEISSKIRNLPDMNKEQLEEIVSNYVEDNFPAFLLSLEHRGWVTSRTLLAPDEWRGRWQVQQKK